MRKLILVLLLLAAVNAFAHAGHGHVYMGSVTEMRNDGSFAMKTTDAATVTVLTSKTTAYLHADGAVATRNDLAVGMRVVVKMTADGKTAASVKMAQ